MIVYENLVDAENPNNHIGGIQDLVQTQSWLIALMLALMKKVALPQIKEIYHSLVKMNKG